MRFLMFTGQGSQWVGMLGDFYKRFALVREFLERADEALGFHLSKLMLEGPEEQLTLTENAQPAILVFSVAVFEVMRREKGFDFDVTAGHSLGEYSALVVTSSLKFEDAVLAVHQRGKLMQEAVPVGVGAMSAVITKAHGEVEEICRNVSSEEGYYCEIANYNASNQVIISGYKAGVEKAGSVIKRNGIGKVIPLKVSAPFHCRLMEPVKEGMKNVLSSVEFEKPARPVIENVNSDIISSNERIKGYLIEQIVEPVRWMYNVDRAISMGADDFVEIGPKNVLASMLKRDKKVDAICISSVADFERFGE